MNAVLTIVLAVQLLSAIAMVVLILLQQGKGADMGAAFGSGASGSLFGASGSANFLSRSTAVLRDRKLALPEAPNRLPEAPLPKAAPMSAPLPCCNRISTTMAMADNSCTAKTMVRTAFMDNSSNFLSGARVVIGLKQ